MIITYPPTSQGSGVAWPTTVGLPKSGLFLKTVFDVIADAFQWGFDRLVFTDGSGDLVERKNLSGYAIPTGLSPSTRYYFYLMTYEGAGCSVRISTESERLGDAFTGLTGLYTHYREIGEFYVDSSGDVVEFKRIGDVVEFSEYTDHALFTGQNFSASYANVAYPAATPERADSLMLVSSSSYGANQALRLLCADDNAGTNETVSETYMLSSWGAYKGNYLNLPVRYRPTEADLSGGLWYRSTGVSSVNNHSIYLAGYEWSV